MLIRIKYTDAIMFSKTHFQISEIYNLFCFRLVFNYELTLKAQHEEKYTQLRH